jgi:hypothetical protein
MDEKQQSIGLVHRLPGVIAVVVLVSYLLFKSSLDVGFWILIVGLIGILATGCASMFMRKRSDIPAWLLVLNLTLMLGIIVAVGVFLESLSALRSIGD